MIKAIKAEDGGEYHHFSLVVFAFVAKMLGVIHKINPNSLIILVQKCCSAKFKKVFLNNIKTPLEVGLKVYYETEIDDDRIIPKLTKIMKHEFDSCSDCGVFHEIGDAQYVSCVLLLLRIVIIIININFSTLSMFKPIQFQICNCSTRDLVKDLANIIDCDARMYKYGPGMKVSFHIFGKAKRYHCVIFPKSPFYEMSQNFTRDNIYDIKGEIFKSDAEDDVLFHLYELKLVRSRDSIINELMSNVEERKNSLF